ncbi:hypothetical protein CUMW_230890 [Citrus unshiu]|uniref:Uncharacterized protein n=1 Tax=Citrus unshiu TaxID=55188 RepID=A0A2H5QHJ4_CITUN|nr:hypothetical protein CUMW_230890 [Citrus unshiu]
MGRVSHGFAVLGRILRSCFTPDAVTFNSLIKEMANGNGEIGVVCKPDTVTYTTIIDGPL